MLTLLFGAGLLAGCAHVFSASKVVGLIQLSSFLLLGIAYAAWMQKTVTEGSEALAGAGFFTLALLVAVGLFSYFAGALNFGQLLLFCCAFLLPSAVAEASRLYCTLATAPRQAWIYSDEIPEEPPFVYLEKKPVHIKLHLESGAEEARDSLAPLSLSLGLAFFYAVKEKRHRDEWRPYFLAENGRPYSWVFYTTRFGFWKTYLHPNETLFENRLRSNSVVIAQRLPQTTGE